MVTREILHDTRWNGRAERSGLAWGTLFSLLTSALALLALVVLVNEGLMWGKRTLDDLRFGFPRRTHLSAVVGHGDSLAVPTHLIALNLDRQIVILEIPGGDTSQIRTLPGPYLFGADGQYEVPRLQVQDIDGDDLGDLLVTIRGEVVVYRNVGTAFQLLTLEERERLGHPGDEGT